MNNKAKSRSRKNAPNANTQKHTPAQTNPAIVLKSHNPWMNRKEPREESRRWSSSFPRAEGHTKFGLAISFRGSFLTTLWKLAKIASFWKFGLSSLAKNLRNEIASPNFQKLANEGLGNIHEKAWQKACYFFGKSIFFPENLLFWQNNLKVSLEMPQIEMGCTRKCQVTGSIHHHNK